jgi:hypothetical protein
MEKGLNVFIRGMYGEHGGYYAILEVFDALFPYLFFMIILLVIFNITLASPRLVSTSPPIREEAYGLLW